MTRMMVAADKAVARADEALQRRAHDVVEIGQGRAANEALLALEQPGGRGTAPP